MATKWFFKGQEAAQQQFEVLGYTSIRSQWQIVTSIRVTEDFICTLPNGEQTRYNVQIIKHGKTESSTFIYEMKYLCGFNNRDHKAEKSVFDKPAHL